MKPSERIESIRDQLVRQDWVDWAGQRHSFEAWTAWCKQDFEARTSYILMAILRYLDEVTVGDENQISGMNDVLEEIHRYGSGNW